MFYVMKSKDDTVMRHAETKKEAEDLQQYLRSKGHKTYIKGTANN